MDLKYIIKKAFQIGLYNIIAVFIRLLSVVVYAHFLTPAQLGNFTVARSFTFIIGVFSLFGLNHGILRQGSIILGQEKHQLYERIKNFSFSISFLLSLLCAVMLLFSSNYIAVNVFHEQNLTPYITAFSLTIPVMNLNFLFIVLLQVKHRSHIAQAYSTLVYPSLIIMCFYLFSFYFVGHKLVIFSFLTAHFLYLIILIKYFKEENVTISLKLEREEKKPLFGISLPMFFAATINQSQKWIDTFLLGILGSSSDVGIYFIGLRIAGFIEIPAVVFNQVYMPIAGRLFGKKDLVELNTLYKSITKIIFIAGSIFFFVLYYFRAEMIGIFGENYSPSVNVLIYVLVGELVNIGVGATRQLLTICGGAKINLVNSILSILLLVGASIILIPKYGIIGAALAHAMSVSILNIISVIELIIIYKLSPFDSRYFFIITLFFALIAICFIISTNSIVVFIILSTLYLLMIYYFGITNVEKNQVKELIEKKLSKH